MQRNISTYCTISQMSFGKATGSAKKQTKLYMRYSLWRQMEWWRERWKQTKTVYTNKHRQTAFIIDGLKKRYPNPFYLKMNRNGPLGPLVLFFLKQTYSFCLSVWSFWPRPSSSPNSKCQPVGSSARFATSFWDEITFQQWVSGLREKRWNYLLK